MLSFVKQWLGKQFKVQHVNMIEDLGIVQYGIIHANSPLKQIIT